MVCGICHFPSAPEDCEIFLSAILFCTLGKTTGIHILRFTPICFQNLSGVPGFSGKLWEFVFSLTIQNGFWRCSNGPLQLQQSSSSSSPQTQEQLRHCTHIRYLSLSLSLSLSLFLSFLILYAHSCSSDVMKTLQNHLLLQTN
ncbi:hypothetical protein CK203_028172 [Vitis vinifera]|uniref:Uncharacterized protein n=1 Tax=Vitis vinifera TaxID=29760 RepID=A0A438IB21_VITVI|nr:hypothetical protein CK203_028172 [Vitis vinifera]